MTGAQRDALLACARPATEEENRIAQVRARLDRHGVLGLVAEVALNHNIALDELLSRSRVKEAVIARHAAWRRLYTERFFSTPQLGELFDVHDNSVREALRRLDAIAARSPSVSEAA